MKFLLATILIVSLSNAAVIDDYLNSLKQEVLKENPNFKEFDFKRGEEIFTSKHMGKKGKEISCTSCHGNNLNETGKNFFTAKEIEPLSPKANPKRLTSVKEMEKWLSRNFNDVYNKEGTAQEKGDVLTYIKNK